jgi:preprotein translocase subunit SecG
VFDNWRGDMEQQKRFRRNAEREEKKLAVRVCYTNGLPWHPPGLQIMLYYLLVGLYVVVCFLLIVVILLQQGKGGDIANAFGGGSSQAVFGARAGATLLTKLTTGLAAAFIVLSLTLAVFGQRGPGSVVGGVAPPPAPTVPGSPVPLPGTNTTPK